VWKNNADAVLTTALHSTVQDLLDFLEDALERDQDTGRVTGADPELGYYALRMSKSILGLR